MAISQLLTTLLSLSDGPLESAVRGKGYAYGVSVSYNPWLGYLRFHLAETRAPGRALEEFHVCCLLLLRGTSTMTRQSVVRTEWQPRHPNGRGDPPSWWRSPPPCHSFLMPCL